MLASLALTPAAAAGALALSHFMLLGHATERCPSPCRLDLLRAVCRYCFAPLG